MSSLRQSPLPTLQALSASFIDLTAILELLLAQPYDQLNASLQSNSSKSDTDDELHGRLDAARMQVSVAYVLMDLVWILLKTKGVDTTNHPVMQELERVKSYFGKIKRVQENEEPEQKGAKVDRSAAGRFIRAALQGDGGVVTGKHTKFDEGEDKAEKVKEVEDKGTPKKKEAAAPTAAPSGTAATSTPSSKKKRPAMDPFEGYDKPKTPKTATPTDSPASTPSKKQKKSKKSSK